MVAVALWRDIKIAKIDIFVGTFEMGCVLICLELRADGGLLLQKYYISKCICDPLYLLVFKKH